MLRLPAFAQTARRPPNSGIVCASSTSRAGLADKLLGFEPHQRERIVHVIDRRLDQRVDALADQAGVGTEDQHDRPRRIGPGEEGLDVGGL